MGAEGIWHAFNKRLRNSTRESFIRDLNTKIAENIEDKIALCSQNLPVHIIPEACQLSQISCLDFMSQFHVSSLPLFLIFPRHRDMLTTGLKFKKHFLGTVVTTGVSDSSSSAITLVSLQFPSNEFSLFPKATWNTLPKLNPQYEYFVFKVGLSGGLLFFFFLLFGFAWFFFFFSGGA